MNTVHTTAPAKIILSGEHAVLHGAPALGAAIQKYCHTRIQALPSQIHCCDIHIPALQCSQTFTDSEITAIYHAMQSQHEQDYTQDQATNPLHFIVYALACFNQQYPQHGNTGLSITIETDIPISAGLGSSAACLVSLLRGLCQFYDMDPPNHELAKLAIKAENLQHGRSSGLDIYLSLLGGCLYMTPNNRQNITTPLPPITWLHTGTAESTTKDCVAHCKTKFSQDSSLAYAFSHTTQAIKQYLIDEPNETRLKHAIQQNHRLLCRLGVVSEYAQQLIQTIEQQGGAAKISGAGTLQGKGCGIIWAVHDPQGLAALAKDQQLQLETSHVHNHETATHI